MWRAQSPMCTSLSLCVSVYMYSAYELLFIYGGTMVYYALKKVHE